MSDLFFPTLKGLGWDTTIEPMFSTTRQDPMSGLERTHPNWRYPRWRITPQYEFIRDLKPKATPGSDAAVYSDLDTILGFFLARNGASGSFLYSGLNGRDARKFVVTGATMLPIAGSTTDFQLAHSIGEYSEPVWAPVGTPDFQVAGNDVDFSTLVDMGIGQYRWPSPPASTPTADFRFAYRCKFDTDSIVLSNFLSYFWQCGGIPLITVKRQ